jgi:tRNA(Ile)-lysidine synthase
VTPTGALTPWLERLVALDDLRGPLVVGCSGGSDSLALLALVCAAGIDAIAVYVDHGLRPGTDFEARLVAEAASRFGAGFELRNVHVEAGSNLEARARDVRYRALAEALQAHGAAAIAVGHTRDDQAETVLLNLLRGSGVSGLGGMSERRGLVRRPLLHMRRSDTVEICARLGLAPVRDAMNDDDQFRRVWLRREVIPMLERGARRDVVGVLARHAALLRDDDAALDAAASAAVDIAESLEGAQLIAATPALARRAIRLWLGGRPPSSEQIEAVLAVARGDQRAVEIGGGRRVERTGGRLHLVSAVAEPVADAVLSLPGRAMFGAYALDAWIEHGPPVAWPDGRRAAVLDADRLDDDVVVRAPRRGERFHPVGATGTKSVLDALAEAGVPATERPARPIVATMSGDVCWVVGYRIDERVKVTYDTRRYLWITSEAA